MKKIFGTKINFVLTIYILIAIFAPLLANDKPLYISVNGYSYFPAFSSSGQILFPGENVPQLMTQVDWRSIPATTKIFAPVPYSPNSLDFSNANYVSPFARQQLFQEGKVISMPLGFRHWFGTNKLGQDVLSGIIYGTRTTLLVGILSILIAVIIGLLTGIAAGYFGNHKLMLSKADVFIFFINLVPAWYYSSEFFHHSIFFTLAGFIVLASWPLTLKSKNKSVPVPVDRLISSVIEIFISLPRLLLLLVIAAIIGPSIKMLILIIGFTSWTEIARIVRVQVIKYKSADFILAAETAGISPNRILLRHLFPNIIAPVKAMAVYGIAAAVLVEASLSFIGAGTPPDTASWGKMMYDGRQNYQAWWIVIFPGMALFLLLYSLRKSIRQSKSLTL